jgi:predicted ATPase
MAAAPPPYITRVVLKNYRSIASCDVDLGPLMFLVGRNGAGKSNFLDALRFIADALNTNLDTAVRSRGSFDDLRYRGAAADAPILLQFDLVLPEGRTGHYALQLAQRPFGGYAIAEEQCSIEAVATKEQASSPVLAGFHIREGRAAYGPPGLQAVPTDRLYLPVAVFSSWSASFQFERPLYDVLANMAFYHPTPAHMRSPHLHEAGDLLLPDGSNAASVVLRLAEQQPEVLQRITEYLRAVLPSLRSVGAEPIGGFDVLRFFQHGDDNVSAHLLQHGDAAEQVRSFTAAAMSDGTLHALGVLVALFQGGFGDARKLLVIGIEEPEAALHPAATAVLRDAFADTAELSQVLVTTQSADLLDDAAIAAESILATVWEDDATRIGPLGPGQQSIIHDHLASAGELLRTSNFRLAPTPPREPAS